VRIAVTGRYGQVAESLIERAAGRPDIEIIPLHRPDFDLLRPETIAPAIEAARPDIVVSAAAYTAVDRAETEPELAFAVNDTGAGLVAAAAAAAHAAVIHFSTDYVFDGESDAPYTETDPPAPRTVYGASKLAGEGAVAAANPRHVIIRTAWVYSPFGANFVKTMLRLAAERDEIAVVADQWGNPTSALDLADCVCEAAPIIAAAAGDAADSAASAAGIFGVYHLAGAGSTNWAGFARAIFAASARNGGPSASVKDIATADYPTQTARPRNSRLSSAKFAATFSRAPSDWLLETDSTVARIVREIYASGVPTSEMPHRPMS
jgi:dTDP-4-dehydrorhamnose reductase